MMNTGFCCWLLAVSSPFLCRSFQVIAPPVTRRVRGGGNNGVFHTVATTKRSTPSTRLAVTSSSLRNSKTSDDSDLWENVATRFHPKLSSSSSLAERKAYTETVTLLRVGVPSIVMGIVFGSAYLPVSLYVAELINDPRVFDVVANDSSQYIQNILTTSGLTFTILVGQTYYFMYQQQEAIYLALFAEVTAAKSLLEQVCLVSQGRRSLYEKMLGCVRDYVDADLTQNFNDVDPADLLSARPDDDPLERVLFLTSVGEPSTIYQTVRMVRTARADRLGALQRKLPEVQVLLLWTLAAVVLCTFPLLGAGVQTIGGLGILRVQSCYFAILVFAVSLTLGIVNELRVPARTSAYNAKTVLDVMVQGLNEELDLRLRGGLDPPFRNN